MKAVVEIAGKQVVVIEGQRVKVPKLPLDEGSKHRFTDVLLLSGDGEMQVGTPHVTGAAVEATVLEHGRGKKIIVFKMKRRKGYRNKNGHRQRHSIVKITDIKV